MTLRFPTRRVAAPAIGSIASLALARSGAGRNPQRRARGGHGRADAGNVGR